METKEVSFKAVETNGECVVFIPRSQWEVVGAADDGRNIILREKIEIPF